jgi:Zn-dependent protease with chaperone function
VVGTLLLLLLFYLALLAGSALLVYGAVIMPMPEKTLYTALAKAGAVAGAIMLFLFLLKGLFKSRRFDDSLLPPIREADQPDLYAFVRRLSREIRAPFPARIYLSPQVNAGVFYSRSLLNLILPVRKNLVIGLGLVNALNVNKFKAVLAHEFGHFSQSATALGVYVYMATSILADMVWGRDAWDDLLAE